MTLRRFGLLSAALVALNLFLWLAPPGLALREAVINQLFGPRLIRAEVIDQAPGGGTQDNLIDRGVITSVSLASITLREQDGRVQSIPLAATTKVTGLVRFATIADLRKNVRVLVFWQANGPATTVQVEAVVGPAGDQGHGKGRGSLP